MGLFNRAKKKAWETMRAFKTKAEALDHASYLRSVKRRKDQVFRVFRGTDIRYRWEVQFRKRRRR